MNTADIQALLARAKTLRRKPRSPERTGERVVLAHPEQSGVEVLDRYDDGIWRYVTATTRSPWDAMVAHGADYVAYSMADLGPVESAPGARERIVTLSLRAADGRSILSAIDPEGYAR